MKDLYSYMEKQVRVETTDSLVFTGLCWGVYGEVQGKEDHGRKERYVEIFDGGSATVIFESEIKDIVEIS